MVESCGVPLGRLDAEPEQITEAAEVSTGSDGFVEDAILADGLSGQAERLVDPPVADLPETDDGLGVDQQVRVGGWTAAFGAVVEPGCQPFRKGRCEQDGPVREVQPPVSGVGERQRTELSAADRVESD